MASDRAREQAARAELQAKEAKLIADRARQEAVAQKVRAEAEANRAKTEIERFKKLLAAEKKRADDQTALAKKYKIKIDFRTHFNEKTVDINGFFSSSAINNSNLLQGPIT